MKKKTKILIIVASVVLIILVAALSFYGYMKNKSAILPDGFTVTAHTGCEDTEDNTLEAINAGYENGVEIVEFDLNFTSDGTPVLAHDEAEDYTVTLDEAFALVAELEGLRVNVDAKSTANLAAVEEIAQKHGVTDRIFYTGIEEKDVSAVIEQTPDIEYWLNFKPPHSQKSDIEYLNSLADKVIEVGAVGINLNHKNCSKELIEVFHERGLLVSIWTVNSKISMIRAVELGPDNITTRQPSDLNEIIESKTGE